MPKLKKKIFLKYTLPPLKFRMHAYELQIILIKKFLNVINALPCQSLQSLQRDSLAIAAEITKFQISYATTKLPPFCIDHTRNSLKSTKSQRRFVQLLSHSWPRQLVMRFTQLVMQFTQLCSVLSDVNSISTHRFEQLFKSKIDI